MILKVCKQAISEDDLCYWELEVKSIYFSTGNYLKIILNVPSFIYFFSLQN